MSGKLTRKERAAQQKAQHAAAVQNPNPSQKKKVPAAAPRANALVRGLSIVLILISVIVYANSLANKYALDDYSIILENGQTLKGAKAFFEIFGSSYREGYMGNDNSLYRPLSKAMFAVEWSLTKGAGINHFMNVALFTLSVVLLFRMLRTYMKGQVLIPFLAALFFAVHPIHTEVVANIKGRDDILCFLFFVVTALYVHRYHVTNNLKYLGFSAGAFFLCFLSKESAITFVAVIPLLLYFFTSAEKKQYLLVGGMLFGITVLFLLIRWAVLGSGGVGAPPVVDNYIAGIDSFLVQRTTAIAIAGLYLLKLFIPHDLVSDASVAEFPVYTFSDWQALLSLAIYLGAFVFAVMKLKQKHPVSFAILYYLVTFSLVSNVLFLIGTNYGERLLYAPSLGICIIMAWIIAKFIQREEVKTISFSDFFSENKRGVMTSLLIAAVFSVVAMMRNPVWHDNEKLYSTDVLISENSCKLHYFYGNHMTLTQNIDQFAAGSPERKRMIDTAYVHLSKALELYPGYSDAMERLGFVYAERLQYDSSDVYYRQAIKKNPTNAMYRNNYGRMLFTSGQIVEATAQFEAAIRFSPGYATAYNNLAGAMGTQGYQYLQRSLANPAMQREWLTKSLGYYEKSIAYSLKAIELDPNLTGAYQTTSMTYQNMANVYNALGDQENTQKYASLAAQYQPKNP